MWHDALFVPKPATLRTRLSFLGLSAVFLIGIIRKNDESISAQTYTELFRFRRPRWVAIAIAHAAGVRNFSNPKSHKCEKLWNILGGTFDIALAQRRDVQKALRLLKRQQIDGSIAVSIRVPPRLASTDQRLLPHYIVFRTTASGGENAPV